MTALLGLGKAIGSADRFDNLCFGVEVPLLWGYSGRVDIEDVARFGIRRVWMPDNTVESLHGGGIR